MSFENNSPQPCKNPLNEELNKTYHSATGWIAIMIEQSFAVRETRYSLIYRKIQKICKNIILWWIGSYHIILLCLVYHKINKFRHHSVQKFTGKHKRLPCVFITNTFCTAYCSEFSLRPWDLFSQPSGSSYGPSIFHFSLQDKNKRIMLK